MSRHFHLTESLPRLRTYHAALDRHETTTPLRSGASKGLRPLGDNRRYTRSKIEVETKVASLPAKVVLSLYGSPLITFFEDDVIEFSHGNWESQSTLGFLRDVYGEKSFVRKGGKIYFVTENNAHYRLSKEGLRVRNGHPINAKPESIVVLNYEKLRALRKKYAPFITYCTNICKIAPTMSSDDWNSIHNSKFNIRIRSASGNERFESNPSNPRIYEIPIDSFNHKYHKELVMQEYKYFFEDIDKSIKNNDWDLMYVRYLNIFHFFHRSSYEDTASIFYKLNVTQFKKAFDEMLKYQFSNEIFERREATLGVIYTHKNEKYFSTK